MVPPAALKLGFFSLLVTGAGFLIAKTVVITYTKVEPIEELVYDPQTSNFGLSSSMLENDYTRCISEPSKVSCYLAKNKDIVLPSNRLSQDNGKNGTSVAEVTTRPRHIHGHPMYRLLATFSDVMSDVGVRFVLIEPSMLFCIVSAPLKYRLTRNDYNPAILDGSRVVLNVALMDDDVKDLEKNATLDKLSEAGFKVQRTRKLLPSSEPDQETIRVTHYLFTKKHLGIHAVVFFQNASFAWHGGFTNDNLSFRSILFSNIEYYDNFAAVELPTKSVLSTPLLIPSDPVHFLFQIPNSKFRGCLRSNDALEEDVIAEDPGTQLTAEQLQTRVTVAIQELKRHFRRQMVDFWLWEDTLKGWEKSCDIFRYSKEFNVAVLFSRVDSVDWSSLFANNHYMQLLNTTIVSTSVFSSDDVIQDVRFDCYGLKVKIHMVYGDSYKTWYFRQADKSNVYKIPLQKISLCSTNIFGQRVNVPCA